MKGEKYITNLIPYGAEMQRGGMVKEADGNPGTNQIEIFWEPPRGDFTKYILNVTCIPDIKQSVTDIPTQPASFVRMTSVQSRASGFVPYNLSNAHFSSNHSIMIPPTLGPYEINNKLQAYTILGLQPGEKYEVRLGTKTGRRETRQVISDIILTKPLPPRNFDASRITTNSCKLTWQHPESCSCLRGYQILVKLGSEVKTEITLLKNNTSYQIRGLSAGKPYDIFLSTLCVAKREEYGGDESRKTESVPVKVDIVTLLEKVRNLQYESSTPDSLTVKWDPETISPNMQYRITVKSFKDVAWNVLFPSILDTAQFDKKEGEDGNDKELIDTRELEEFIRVEKAISGEQRSHKFTDFPDKIGSGFPYEVEIVSTAKISKENKESKEAISEPVTKVFYTLPYPPSNIRIENDTIKWDPSPTPHITQYHLRWELINNNEKVAKDETVPYHKIDCVGKMKTSPSYKLSDLFHQIDLSSKIYKISASAVVDIPKVEAPVHQRRSLETSERFRSNEDGECERYVDEQASMVP